MRNYCIDVRIVYSTFNVKNYFPLKCRTLLSLMANVIYKLNCSRDAKFPIYIGKTKQHLATRECVLLGNQAIPLIKGSNF